MQALDLSGSRTRLRSLATVASVLVLATGASAQIVNGDFSAGNSGFISDYTYNESNLTGEGSYNVGTNPNLYHVQWASFGDHTSGSGRMLIANGSPSSSQRVWAQNVLLLPGSTYAFSFWGASQYSGSPARLRLIVNGLEAGITPDFPLATGVWRRYEIDFTTGTGTSTSLAITNAVTAFGGNDFVLDDFAVQPVPEPASFAALGLGALALLRRRKTA